MRLSLQGKSAIIITNRGDSLVFPISGNNSFENTALIKKVVNDEGGHYDPFADINGYIASLPSPVQSKLFEVYAQINEDFADFIQFEQLRDFLEKCFKEIYDIVTVDAVEEFMMTRRVIHIPDVIENNESGYFKEERTYTPEKYRGLIALSIALKLAIPIWGAFIRYITKGTGVGRKEIHCARLLKESSVVHSKQYNEFVDFVVHTFKAGEVKADSILAGFGTEEQATLLPAACLVRKIAVAPNLKSESAASVAFNYVVNDGPGHDRKHPYIRAKTIEKGLLLEERALLETYQMTESISAGDLELIAYYCEQIPISIRHICPTIPDHYVEEAVKLRDYLIKRKYKPTLFNLRLVQFFIKEIPSQIVPNLDSEDLINLLKESLAQHKREIRRRLHQAENDVVRDEAYIAQLKEKLEIETNPDDYRTYAKISLLSMLFTVLIYLGYPSIALMVTAQEVPIDGIDASIGTTRKQIPSDIDAMLDKLYPLRISGGKDSVNMVKDAISRYFNQIAGKSYRSTYTDFFKPFVEAYEDREGTHFPRPETPIALAKITNEMCGS